MFFKKKPTTDATTFQSGMIELWAKWSLVLPNECATRRNEDGSWSAWDNEHTVDVIIIEVGGNKDGYPIAAAEMLKPDKPTTHKNGWEGSIKIMQELDGDRHVNRYCIKAAAENTWLSCYISYLVTDKEGHYWAEKIENSLAHGKHIKRSLSA